MKTSFEKSNLHSFKLHRRDKPKNVDFQERLICVNRVSNVVKGGRKFSFSALVVIGNEQGNFGFGLGKAAEVSEAKKKATNNAKNNLYHVVLTKAKTIPHQTSGQFGASNVIIRPANVGHGIIAGNTMRSIFECIGIKDIVAKTLGSPNPHNVVKATINALMMLKAGSYYKNLRRKIIENITESANEEGNVNEDEEKV